MSTHPTDPSTYDRPRQAAKKRITFDTIEVTDADVLKTLVKYLAMMPRPFEVRIETPKGRR